VARDALFRIASTAKPIAAAATLALAAEGLIGLDEPVNRLLPELATWAGAAPDGWPAGGHRAWHTPDHRP